MKDGNPPDGEENAVEPASPVCYANSAELDPAFRAPLPSKPAPNPEPISEMFSYLLSKT